MREGVGGGGGCKKGRYRLKGKQWHPLVIKEFYPYLHKALPDTLLLSFQSLQRTAALISAHRQGSLGSMEKLRHAKAVEDMTSQWGGQLATLEPPAAFRHLRGSFCPWAANSKAVLDWGLLDQGLLIHIMPRGHEPARSSEPDTARSQWDPAADTVHTLHPWEDREVLTRQCHVLWVNHTGHFFICKFSKRQEVYPVALNNVMMVVCVSEGQKGPGVKNSKSFFSLALLLIHCALKHSSSPRDLSGPLHKPSPVININSIINQ